MPPPPVLRSQGRQPPHGVVVPVAENLIWDMPPLTTGEVLGILGVSVAAREGTLAVAGLGHIGIRTWSLPLPARADAALAVRQILDAAPDTAAVVFAGYGPASQVVALAGALQEAATAAGMRVLDIARVAGDRFWSCIRESPLEGEPVTFPAPDRVGPALLTPSPDPDGVMTREAEAAFEWLDRTGAAAGGGTPAFMAVSRAGIRIVTEAVGRYRKGGSISNPRELGRLMAVLSYDWPHLDAYAQMDPRYCEQHTRLWRDVTAAAPPGLVAGPASLLMFTALQAGSDELARAAAGRALGDPADPEWPGPMMARQMLKDANSGLPMRGCKPHVTREEARQFYCGIPSGGRDPGR